MAFVLLQLDDEFGLGPKIDFRGESTGPFFIKKTRNARKCVPANNSKLRRINARKITTPPMGLTLMREFTISNR